MKLTFVFYTLLFALLLPLSSFAQNEENTTGSEPDSVLIISRDNGKEVEVIVNDTVVISLGRKKIVIIKNENGTDVSLKGPNDDDYDHYEYDDDDDDDDRHKNHSEVGVFSLDLGVTNYFVDGNLGVDAAIPQLELKNFRPGSHVGLHFLPTKASLISGVVNLETALTIDYNNYYFTRSTTLKPNQPELTFEDSVSTNFSRNKLTARYFQIPLMLNFDTKPYSDDGVDISIGAYGGVLWHAKTKQVTNIDGEKVKTKIDDDFNLNPWRYGLIARIDIHWFNVYLQYNLSELFKPGEGPSTQTFMAGINIIEF